MHIAREEYTADGRYTQTTATVEKDSLVKIQIFGTRTKYEIREFQNGGKEMLLHLKPEIICKRVDSANFDALSLVPQSCCHQFTRK